MGGRLCSNPFSYLHCLSAHQNGFLHLEIWTASAWIIKICDGFVSKDLVCVSIHINKFAMKGKEIEKLDTLTEQFMSWYWFSSTLKNIQVSEI